MKKSLRNIALDLLALREHSCFELTQKLSLRSFSKEEIDLVIGKLKQEGLISDARFTETYINSRFKRGFGPKRIEQELIMKGVDEILIDDLLWKEPWDWLSLIDLEYYKKFKLPPATLNEKLKQAQFLYYRGFTHDMIKTFFKKIEE